MFFGVFLITLSMLVSGCNPILPVGEMVPPPEIPPAQDGIPLRLDSLKIQAEGLFWIDSMPSVPTEGAPFYCLFTLTIENSGDEAIAEFNATRASLCYAGTKDEFHSFSLISTLETVPDETIPAHTMETLYYRGKDPFYSRELDDDSLYACIKVEWNTALGVVTTPPAGVTVTW